MCTDVEFAGTVYEPTLSRGGLEVGHGPKVDLTAQPGEHGPHGHEGRVGFPGGSPHLHPCPWTSPTARRQRLYDGTVAAQRGAKAARARTRLGPGTQPAGVHRRSRHDLSTTLSSPCAHPPAQRK